MDWEKLLLVVLPAISGIVLGWSAHASNVRKAIQSEAGADAVIRRDVAHIKERVDEIYSDTKNQGDRLARVEESAKSAHKRIDRIEGVLRHADN